MNEILEEAAIFKLSYGLFFLGSKYDSKENVCVVNTVSQVTESPLRVSVTVLKTNLTAEMINASKLFTVGVIGENAELADVAHFGQQSGRDCDKLSIRNYQLDSQGIPIYNKGCISQLSANVVQTIDLDTHYMFIAEIYEAKVLNDDDAPMTYAMYRAKKSGKSVSSAPKSDAWQCSICHYVYDGDTPFEELPDDYICPVCKQPKSAFKKV